MDSDFVAYVGPSELHDGQIIRTENAQDTVTIFVEGDTGRRFALAFYGVIHQNALLPEGMWLYALCEMRHSPPHRKFVFAGWEEDETKRLEITAEGFRVIESVQSDMSEIKETAEYYRLGLILGVVPIAEAMGWLDVVLVSESEPDMALIEASLSGSRGPFAVAEELKQVNGQYTRQAVTYRLFPAMLRRLQKDPKTVRAITGWLYTLVSEGYVPDEPAGLIMWSFDDEFSLAVGGIYGAVNEIARRLARFLTNYAAKDS